MSCYYPVQGYRSADLKSKGIVFSAQKGFKDLPMQVPCGRCLGCRMDRARDWAVRCVQEASLFKENCFLTLTYAPEHLPTNGSLRPRDFVLFMKKLRKVCSQKIRFFQCGEYGEGLQRPHHHCIIFGWRPVDLKLWKTSGDVRLYRSETVEKCWNKGFVTVGDVTYESAYYISRYILKKVLGENSASHYGEKKPEYITMSRMPGIGRKWIEKFHEDVYKRDYVVYGLDKLKAPPRYYDKVYSKINPERLELLKKERRVEQAASDYNSPERLVVREKVQLSRSKLLVRKLEKGEV